MPGEAEPTGGDLCGLTPGAAALTVAGLLDPRRCNWLIAPTAEEADRMARGARLHLRDAGLPIPVLPFLEDDLPMFNGGSPDPRHPLQRLLARAAAEDDRAAEDRGAALIVASAAALGRGVPALERWAARTGEELPARAWSAWLIARGWIHSPELEGPGTFRRAGDTWWLWLPGEPGTQGAQAQIRCFDDEIEEIRVGEARLSLLRVPPVREVCLSPERCEAAVSWLLRRRADRGGQGPDLRAMQRDLRDGVPFAGMEALLPALSPLQAPWADLPPDRTFLYEPERCRAEIAAAEEAARRRYAAIPLRERPWAGPDDLLASPPLPAGRALRRVAGPGARDMGARPASIRIGTDAGPAAGLLKERLAAGARLTVVVEGAERAAHIKELFAAHGLKLHGPDEKQPGQRPRRQPAARIILGDLPEGFELDGRIFLSARELFGDRLSSPAGDAANRRRLQRGAAGFSRLQRGAAVIHRQHGVGLFRGIVRLPVQPGEPETDCVQIEYRDRERLYLPVWRLDQLSLWRAPDGADPGTTPPLDRLGGSSFGIRRAKVRDDLLALAHRLLSEAAERRARRTRPFDPPGSLYQQFAASFPYTETEDQTRAIEEILADLEQPRPMDRLLVGDVGFGKTEVALRAAFRAIEEGRQAVFLCPSTLLCWQHARRFEERLAGTPVRVAALSRTATGREAQEVLRAVREGRVDLLVGTHRLLSAGLQFRDLGLVIIDEEHRFGVRQKEQARRLARDVHCLMLSATPIPRSLHLAMSGLCALSVLQTPPAGRLSVRTEALPFSAQRISDDVRAELSRGGQVFFVHNRVQSIQRVAAWLGRLVPEARIGVVHGQLSGAETEREMERVVRGEVDVLVCTALIESGIDLPRVNTMIINRADQFGLAQLHQLRGRVGRGDLPARCTLLLPQAGLERRAALERVAALQEAGDLGGGMGLASRDLELRGSGDLLGERQHGAIASIGLDAYVELLEEAVERARGRGPRPQVEPELELPIPAFLPEDRLPDTGERLELYRWMAEARSIRELSDLEDRLHRRLGPDLPDPARNLLHMAGLRLQMRPLLISAISLQRLRATVTLHPEAPIPTEALLALCRRGGRFRLSPEGRLTAALTPEEGADAKGILQAITLIMSQLQALVSTPQPSR